MSRGMVQIMRACVATWARLIAQWTLGGGRREGFRPERHVPHGHRCRARRRHEERNCDIFAAGRRRWGSEWIHHKNRLR
eukprot:5057120-Pyramimonas_sp.AAC.1